MFKFSAIIAATIALWSPTQSHSAPRGCVFTSSDNLRASEVIAVIKGTMASCAVPWRALKRLAANSDTKTRLEAAYRDVAAKHPDLANAVAARIADVEAAAGNPGPMLAIADANVTAHPEDKTLANMSCFVRASYGFDIDHAMSYCDAAVANGRPGYALVNRGKAELQLGKFREALDDFDEVLRVRRDVSDRVLIAAAFGRGVARIRLGDGDGSNDIDLATKASTEVAADFADFGIKPRP